MTNLDSVFKRRDITLPAKVCIVKAMVFPIVMYRCESWTIKKTWVLKNSCLWTMVREKTLESPLDCKEIKPVNPKGNQTWIFIGRTDAEAEAPILWPPDGKSQLSGKDADAGKDWGHKEKGLSEDEMHQWLNEQEFEQAPGGGEGREARCAAVHGVTKSRTRLSNWMTIRAILFVDEQSQVTS